MRTNSKTLLFGSSLNTGLGERSLLLAGFAAYLILSVAVRADDWPQWRGPNRDGLSQEKGWQTQWPAEGPKKLWEAPVGIGYSSMSVAKGRLYTMGNVKEKDVVSCLNPETGKVVWAHEYDCPSKDINSYDGTRSTPTADGDRVYTLSRHGHLFCLEAATGKVLWSKDFKKDFGGKMPTWGWAGSVLIEKDWALVEVGGPGVSAVALNKTTGDVIWKNGNDEPGYSSTMAFDAGGERCLTVFTKEHFVARRMKDGSELCRLPWKTDWGVNASTPIIVGNKIFIASGYGFGCALLEVSPSAFKEVWRHKNMKNHVNSCVLWNGHLYGFDERKLRCLDWNTGRSIWDDDRYGKGSLIIADGKMIIWSDKGKLALAEASPDAFKELASAQILQRASAQILQDDREKKKAKETWAHPVLANGRLYVRNLDQVACLDVKK